VLLSALFFLAAHAGAQTLNTLYTFAGDTAQYGGVVIGKGGVLYGNAGDAAFSLSPPAAPGGAWTESTIYTSTEYSTEAGLVIGKGGVLYGTLFLGGTHRAGAVFSLTPPKSSGGAWTQRTLYSFQGSKEGDGYKLYSGVVVGPGGVLYGTTWQGGTSAACNPEPGCGTVFALTPPASAGEKWTETILHSFTGPPNDGSYPYAGVVVGSNGVVYGTTYDGGANNTGTVYSLTPPSSPGGEWTEAVLYSFSYPGGIEGSDSFGGVVIGSGGVLYGATGSGGANSACFDGCGTVYSLTPPASPGGAWAESVLYSFAGGTDGWNPQASLAIGSGGVLYGSTLGGGNPYGGTIFSLTPPASSGDPWTWTLLASLNGDGGDGYEPSGLVLDSSGNLYGTTYDGGPGGGGTVFQLVP
jgi:uncharacterized repeat protein (TIGR03803 family)